MSEWAKYLMNEWRTDLDGVIARGDDRQAGILAGRITCFANAIARVNAGRSASLENDPLYGRSMNIVEYFYNPRPATAGDHLGDINDWSI